MTFSSFTIQAENQAIYLFFKSHSFADKAIIYVSAGS
jgi:hypothetical protein